ncbi:MAG: alkaline shock response membrane anchor protein AmaP [Bacillota bacterium]
MMKPKLIDRFLLLIILLLVLVLALLCLAFAAGLIPQALIVGFVGILYGNPVNAMIACGIGLVLAILALRLMFAGHKRAPAPMPQSVLIKSTENGTVYISLAAIDTMVQKHCRAQNRIRECESMICPTKDGVAIRLKLSTMPDTNLPEMTASLQETLKEYIQSLSGISVVDIPILISSTGTIPKNRVE